MAKEQKALCRWGKDEIEDRIKKLKKIVSDPRFICRKCARVAKSEDYLCKPEEL